MAPVLGYWNMRGYAQPIRFLLAHVGEEYIEKNYGPVKKTGPKGEVEWDYSEWFDAKYNLGLDFPNLPYYKDGKVEMTESIAILRLLADKHNLNPATVEEKRRVYMAEHHLIEFRASLPHALYCDQPELREKLIQEHINAIPEALKSYSSFLGKNKWIAGDKLTYVDFLFYEVIFHQHVYMPGCLDQFANLKEFMLRFQALPNIAKYVQTDKFKGLMLFRPLVNIEANFNFPPIFK